MALFPTVSISPIEIVFKKSACESLLLTDN
jgi:hypothetical protein